MSAALLSIEKSKIDPSPQVIANSAHFRNDTLNPSIAFTGLRHSYWMGGLLRHICSKDFQRKIKPARALDSWSELAVPCGTRCDWCGLVQLPYGFGPGLSRSPHLTPRYASGAILLA